MSIAATVAAVVTDGFRRRESTARHLADARKAEAVEQGRIAEVRRREADHQRRIAEASRREALSSAAGAQLDRACALADGGQVGLGMLWTARALGSAVRAGDADLARVARANLAHDRLRVPAVLKAGWPEIDDTKLPAGQRVIVRSADGRVVLAEPPGGPARLFDHADGRVIVTIPPRYFFSADFGRDGKALVLSSPGGFYRIIDTTSGAIADCQMTLPPPAPGRKDADREFRVRYLDGSKLCLIEASDGRRALRAAPSGRLLREWGPAEKPIGIAADPQAARFAAPLDANRAQVYDAATGDPIGVPIDAGGPILGLSLPPGEGRTLWTRVGEQYRIFGIDDGKAASPPVPVPKFSRSSTIELPLFSDDGRVALTMDGQFGVIRDAKGGQLSRFLPDDTLSAASFSDDGRFLLTGEYRKAVLRDARTGLRLAPSLEATTFVHRVGFAPGGRELTVEGELRDYEVEDGRRAMRSLPARDAIAVAYRPDGREVAATSGDEVRRWDPASGRGIGEPIPGGEYPGSTRIVYSPGGDLLLVMGAKRPGRLIETATGALRATLSGVESATVFDARFSPDGALIAVALPEEVRFWDARTGLPSGDPLRFAGPARNFQAGLAFHPEGRTIAAFSSVDTVAAWSLPSRRPAFPALEIANARQLITMEFGRGGTRLAVGVFSPATKRLGAVLIDADTGRAVAELTHDGLVQYVDFTPDGRLLLTSSQDGTVRAWDARDGRPVGSALRFATTPLVVAAAPDGRTFLTVEQGDGSAPSSSKARLWDLATHRPIGPPLVVPGSGWAYSAAFAPDSRSVVIGSVWRDQKPPEEARDAVIWRLPPPVPEDATPDRVALWAEVVSGTALTADGSPEPLSAKDWNDRNDRLRALGGPPVSPFPPPPEPVAGPR